MNIEGEKIKALIEVYGKSKGYPEKSYLPKFCEDFNLNYVQWFSYSNNKQKAGIKILYILMNIFPKLNLNWFFKNEGGMFSEFDVSHISPKQESREEVRIEFVGRIENSITKITEQLEQLKEDLKAVK